MINNNIENNKKKLKDRVDEMIESTLPKKDLGRLHLVRSGLMIETGIGGITYSLKAEEEEEEEEEVSEIK